MIKCNIVIRIEIHQLYFGTKESKISWTIKTLQLFCEDV